MEIKLKSSCGKVFPVDVEVAKKSVTIKTMMEDLGFEEGCEEAVPLPNVSADILEKVLKWAEYHKDDPAPTEDEEKYRIDISIWDQNFLKVSLTIICTSN